MLQLAIFLNSIISNSFFVVELLKFPEKQLQNIQTIIFFPILTSYFFLLDVEIIKTSEHCLIEVIIKNIFVLILISIKMILIFYR